MEAEAVQDKNKTGRADQAPAFIQQLYRLEKQAKGQLLDQRHAIRQTQAKPILDKLQKWLAKSLGQVPPKSAMGKACIT